MVSGQPAVVSKEQVREGHGAVRCYRPETRMHGPLAHQAEHLPFKQVVPGSSPGRLIPTQRPSGIHTSTHKRPHRLAWSRTSPFHGGNGGSNPPGDAKTLSFNNQKGRRCDSAELGTDSGCSGSTPERSDAGYGLSRTLK